MAKQSRRSPLKNHQKDAVTAPKPIKPHIAEAPADAAVDTAPKDLTALISTILWTIYSSPSDAPGRIVLRPHVCLVDGRVVPSKRNWVRDSIEECRQLIPKSAHRLSISDPSPTISEVWMQQVTQKKPT
jgi:hypothetical protein